MEKTKIKFNFHPFEKSKSDFSQYALLTKAEGDVEERRYMQGVCSGLGVDHHGERMSKKAIVSFMDQFESGNLLLYTDIHGIQASQDIGIAKNAQILENGDWFVKFRLYDSKDNIGPNKQEVIDTIWNQAKGLPPYDRPFQKGFSIEGYVPTGGIIEQGLDEYGNQKPNIIDAVELDGVVLVPRPAYKDSVAHAVYKALGELHPERKANIKKSIASKLQEKVAVEELRDQYWEKKWDVNNATEELVENIMRRPNDPTKREQIGLVFDEYKEIMINLLMGAESLFIKESENSDGNISDVTVQRSMIGIVSELNKQLGKIRDIKKSQLGIKNENIKRKTLT